MWRMFGGQKSEMETIDQKPDIELLNGNCYECSSCHVVLSLINYNPLAIEKCTECNALNFVPYAVKDYWLYRPLGGGGMGSVYKAMHYRYPDMEFAVKILPREKKTNQHLIEALIREASIGKSFGRHPHLTYVADYGHYRDEYFSAMEFCPGKRMDQLIEAADFVPQRFVLLWAMQVLSAEQRMFDCGYLYRDLKPQNIMIDADGNIMMIDYGLCMKVEQALNKESETVDGSPLYMPPERIIGHEENMSSEIYSLGMVMFHALSKKTYYTASGAYELAKKHVTSLRMASVRNRLPSTVSPKIAEMLDKMVARMPSERFQSYKEAAIAIKNVYNVIKD